MLVADVEAERTVRTPGRKESTRAGVAGEAKTELRAIVVDSLATVEEVSKMAALPVAEAADAKEFAMGQSSERSTASRHTLANGWLSNTEELVEKKELLAGFLFFES